MWCKFLVVVWSALAAVAGLALGGNVAGMDDSILFKMRWKDPLDSIDPPPAEFQNHDMVRMVSSNKEPYVCFIPRKLEVKGGEPEDGKAYQGPTPLEVLEPLFVHRICRYKLDSYWTYQLCHGKSLRQYHEDTTGSKVHIVEFYLGKYDLDMMKADNEKYKTELAERQKMSPDLKWSPSTIKLDGVDHPYFAVNMSFGTICDINQRPRTTQVWYVCDMQGDHDVQSFEEPSSCTYRVIVRTPLLCKHPDYRVEVAPENEISCHPEKRLSQTEQKQAKISEDEGGTKCSGPSETVSSAGAAPDGTCSSPPQPVATAVSVSEQPNEPSNLQAMARENADFRQNAVEEAEASGTSGNLDDDFKRTLKIYFMPEDDEEELANGGASEAARREPAAKRPPQDPRHVERFLNGDFCLQGGTGWWRYEFCYGKRVKQFHVEKGVRTQEILLGKWNPIKHRAWVEANPRRKVSPDATHVSHFYTGGDLCEVTQRPRTVEVKLACKEIKGHPDAVSIFLQEPKPCEYKLTVESTIVCAVLDAVDDFGLPADETPVEDHWRGDHRAGNRLHHAASQNRHQRSRAAAAADHHEDDDDDEAPGETILAMGGTAGSARGAPGASGKRSAPATAQQAHGELKLAAHRSLAHNRHHQHQQQVTDEDDDEDVDMVSDEDNVRINESPAVHHEHKSTRKPSLAKSNQVDEKAQSDSDKSKKQSGSRRNV